MEEEEEEDRERERERSLSETSSEHQGEILTIELCFELWDLIGKKINKYMNKNAINPFT